MAQHETKVLTAHVPLPLADKVDQLAARLERSRGWVVKQALGAWVEQEEVRSRLTREAMADVQAGRVIDQEAVQAWTSNLNTESRNRATALFHLAVALTGTPAAAAAALRDAVAIAQPDGN